MTEGSVLQVFVFREGAYVGNEIFTEPEIVIGRGDGVDLSLDDELVARNHAMLSHENGQATLLKLGSSSVFVNRTQVEHTYVTPRDEIQIGAHTLKIKFLTPKAPSLRPSPQPADAARARATQEVMMRAGFADDLSTEAMTELLDRTRPPAAWPSPQSARPVSAPPSSLFEEETSIPATRIRERASHAKAARPRGQITSSIEITGSDVLRADSIKPIAATNPVAEHASMPASSSPSSGPSVEAVWDEGPSSPFSPAALSANAVEEIESAFRELARSPGSDDEPSPSDTARIAVGAGLDFPHPDPASSPPNASSPWPEAGDFAQAPVDRTLKRPRHVETAAPRPGDVDDDLEEEEIDALVRPGFSLIRSLVQTAEAPKGIKLETDEVLEVIGFSNDSVRSSALLKRPGARYVLGRAATRGGEAAPAGYAGLKLAKIIAPGVAEIEFPTSAEGVVIEPERRVQLDQLKVPQNAVSKKGDLYRARLQAGSTCTIKLGAASFHLRFVRPPAVAGPASGFAIDRQITRSLFSSVILHVLAGIVVGLSLPGPSYSEAAREVWSEHREEIREVEIKPPEPEPVPEPEKPEPVPEPEAETKPPPEEPKERPKKPTKRTIAPSAGIPKPLPEKELKTQGVLGAMGKLNIAAPGRKSVVEAVSNIDAVRAPGGSNFRVGALVGKLPVSEVSVGGGGGGGVLTRGGAELLRGGSGFALEGKRDGKVRGQVTRVNARQVEAKGSISREEVAAVINQHLKEVQYCYEKTLLKEPGLQGKLILEWSIETDGTVGRVKEKLSTLKNPAVSSCISSSLKRWQFPKPRGGIVIVSYPFIFNAVGF